jgi:hypothetical protein
MSTLPPQTGNPVNTQPGTPKLAPKRRRWPLFIVVGFFAVVIFGSVGFVTATALEDHDSFCISCHTVPETTYYNNAYESLDTIINTPDLASQHYMLAHQKGDTFACITCHRGDASLGNRVAAITLGGRDTVTWVLGREDPTLNKQQITEGWLANNSCVNCHKDTLLTLKGISNHFHNNLPITKTLHDQGNAYIIPKDYQGDTINTEVHTVNTALTCTSCHKPHETMQDGASNKFIDSNSAEVKQACAQCHKDDGQE